MCSIGINLERKGVFTMTDPKKLLDMFKGLDDDAAIDRAANMVKTGQAGISSAQAAAIASQLLPMLDKKQQEKLRKLIRKLR